MRKLVFLTWNTRLYEMGNKLHKRKTVKPVNLSFFNNVINKVKEFLDTNDSAIAVLQEIPFKCNIDAFREHILFSKFIAAFPGEEYSIIYNISTVRQIKMTVVLAKKTSPNELIFRKEGALNNNMCVSFGINDLDLSLIGVHPHNADQLYNWLMEFESPDLIIGDFNAGDYCKKYEDDNFKKNRENYRKLASGYIDACNNQVTTAYSTSIDHILIKNTQDFLKKFQYGMARIERNDMSDHYPVYFDLLCPEDANAI